MSQQLNDTDESLSEVNVIPLADLSLVLLIILMVMSPMITQALIQVSAANAAAAQTQEELTTPEVPVIITYQQGSLKINGEVVGTQPDVEFVKVLETKMAGRKDKSVIMTAAPDLTHGEVVRLMDVCKHHGAESLVLVKWDPNSGAQPS